MQVQTSMYDNSVVFLSMLIAHLVLVQRFVDLDLSRNEGLLYSATVLEEAVWFWTVSGSPPI